MKRNRKYDFLGEWIVMFKDEKNEFPLAVFLCEDDAETYMLEFPDTRYIVHRLETKNGTIYERMNILEKKKEGRNYFEK